VDYRVGDGKPHQPLVLDDLCVTGGADPEGKIIEAEVLAELKFTLQPECLRAHRHKGCRPASSGNYQTSSFSNPILVLLNNQIRNGSTNSSHLLMPRRHDHRNERLG
jgi:hypothetical protein